MLLSDTVGFIRRLPQRLFASFESTLAEAVEASLLVVVVDLSDPERRRHLETTNRVLQQLGAAGVPRFVVFSKLDQAVPPPEVELFELSGGHPCMALCTRDAVAVARLRTELLAAVRSGHERREVFVRYEQADVVRAIYAQCRVLRSRATAAGTQFLIEGPDYAVAAIAETTRKRKAKGE